ncbi:hypothetical protein [Paraburkholderia sp. RL17-373-BIF-A]
MNEDQAKRVAQKDATRGDIRWMTELTDENCCFTSGTCSKL